MGPLGEPLDALWRRVYLGVRVKALTVEIHGVKSEAKETDREEGREERMCELPTPESQQFQRIDLEREGKREKILWAMARGGVCAGSRLSVNAEMNQLSHCFCSNRGTTKPCMR